jgi:hypothetical protein
MNILFLMIAEARRLDRREVQFASRSEILSMLRLGVDAENLRKIIGSLELWSDLTIRFETWYFPGNKIDGRWHPGTRGPKKLRPPVRSFRVIGHRVRVVIEDSWLEKHPKYWERVPLPLPRQAAAQNLVLSLATSLKWTPDDEGVPGEVTFAYKRGVRQLCRKVGLNHTTRNRVFRQAIKAAQVWFEANGGELDYTEQHGQIVFYFKKPKGEYALPLPTPRQKKLRKESSHVRRPYMRRAARRSRENTRL